MCRCVIWGKASQGSGDTVEIEVDRFEPAYPDVRLQAWLGLASGETVGGQPVWVLTTPDAEKFVLGSTVGGKSPHVEASLLNDPVIVEGVQIPGEALGEYPVIDDINILPGVGRNDLEGYHRLAPSPG